MLKILAKTLVALLLLLPVRAGAAEFDIDSGRVILRRLQLCLDCGSALLVTGVHPGVPVRCPDCGREQPRLDNRYLITQLYQICRLCMGPLDTRGRRPGDIVECGACHTRQGVSRDVFATGADADGLGYVPGFPPGSAKKTLAYSFDAPDAPLTPVPLDDPFSDLPLPGPALTAVPRPPAAVVPEPAAVLPPPLLSEPETARPAPEPAAPDDDAVSVPAVTVDLFGGGGRQGAGSDPGFVPSGRMLARVDGDPVYAAEVDRITGPVLRRLREKVGPEGAGELAARENILRREVLERLVDRRLAVREAAAAGHRPDAAAVRARERELAPILSGTGIDLRREAERDVVMADMHRRFARKPGAVSPEALREFYRAHRDEMMRPRLLALEQLVVFQHRAGRPDPRDHREIALEVSGALERGERFDDLRQRYDEFAPAAGVSLPAAAAQPESAYAAGILDAAGDLRKGAVFGPLFLDGAALFGKVAEVRPEGPIPFEEVEAEIRRRLENEAAEKSLDEWLKRLRERARIEYFEE